MKNQIILTDCDGVLLNWAGAFHDWMKKKGHIRIDRVSNNCAFQYGLSDEVALELVAEFNHSEHFAKLSAFRDAKDNVRKLAEAGFRFLVITSCTDNKVAACRRFQNLNDHFGNVFTDLICLPLLADKEATLVSLTAKYRGCYWIEDTIVHADVGHRHGYDSVLIEQAHNEHYSGPVKLVKNWTELSNHIIGEK